MTERQLAIFLDADWVDPPHETALQMLCELTRNDIVQTHQVFRRSPVLAPDTDSGVRDPILRLALQAYLWLCERYRDGTDVYLFGYSAGGIAALRLARLIGIVGLLRVPDESLVEEALAWDATVPHYVHDELYSFRHKYSRIMPIRFLGLLDPAAPFGHDQEIDLAANREWIADGRLNPLVSHAFSALAVDETSDLYQPVQWTRVRRARFVTQIWYRGSHFDMGHLSSDEENPLGVIPLERLASEAKRRGLALQTGWKRDIRRARRSGARQVTGASGPLTFHVGRSPRQIGRVFGETFDSSVSLPTTGSINVPRTGLQITPRAEAALVPLTEADAALFLLNDMKPPLEWFEERPHEENLPPSAADLAAISDVPTVPRDRLGDLPPAPPAPRFLLAQFRQGSDELRSEVAYSLEPDRPTWVEIAIGPSDPDWLSASGSEDFVYDSESRQKRDELTVVLSGWEGLPEPQIRHILLPKRGRSTDARFALGSMRGGTLFHARVTVLHRNRVLQSSILRATVGASVKASLTVDVGILEDLSNLRLRAPADISLIINERPSGEGRALFIEGELAREIAADANDPVLQGILHDLEDLARDHEMNRNEAKHPKKVLRLRNLAVRGHNIYKVIRDALTFGSHQLQPPPWPQRIQVIAAHTAQVYPLEFAYDYPPPGATNANVKVCPHWDKDAALEQGTSRGCYERCSLQSYSDVVCPNGFWGVKKIIERHAFQVSTPDAAQLRSNRVQRKPLSLHGAAILGVSQIVHETEPDAAAAILASLQASLRSSPTEPINNWEHLKELVQTHAPPLIVLLPHVQNTGPAAGEAAAVEGMYLEIESFVQAASEIDRLHVIRDDRAPLVVFLGCQGAINFSKYDNGLDHFRRAGAAAVIAPAAIVAPANVVKFVSDLADALQKTLGKRTPYIGQALRDARRLQFMRGNFPALSIMAFGDADLRLTLKE